jgi:hypothetical protein
VGLGLNLSSDRLDAKPDLIPRELAVVVAIEIFEHLLVGLVSFSEAETLRSFEKVK